MNGIKLVSQCFFKPNMEERGSWQDRQYLTIQRKVVVHPVSFDIFYWLETSHRSCPYSREGDYSRA